MKRHRSTENSPDVTTATRRTENPHPLQRILLPCLLLAISITAYIPATRCGTIWDDDFHVTDNRLLRSAEGLWRIWTEFDATPQFYPLTHTTFWLEYHVWGLWPAGYHIVNIVLHATGVILLWRVLRRLGVPGAGWAAAIFALHPVHVESVAWITERKNVLSCVFYLAAAWTFLSYAQVWRCEPAQRRSGKMYVLSFVLFLFALWSKTVTCTLPAALLLVIWWKRGRIAWKDVAALIPFFLFGLMMGLVTVSREKELGAVGFSWDYSFIERWLIAGRALCFHASKLVWPTRLTFIYPRWQIDAGMWWQYLFPVAVMTVILVLWLARHRIGRGPITAILFFAGTLVPALGFFDVYPMRYSFVADHYQHLASLGLIALCVALVHRASERWNERGKVLSVFAGVLVLMTFGGLTWQQQSAYRNTETLWRDTIHKNPDAWMAHNHLGTLLFAQGKPQEAIRHYRETLRLKPDHVDARNNWGNALASLGRFDEAIRQYQSALQVDPGSPRVLCNLANALASSGRPDLAIAHYRRALSLHPDYADAHYNLGIVLEGHGEPGESIDHYRRAVQIRPDYAEAHNRLASALIGSNRIEEGVTQYREAIRLKPDWPAPMNDLAWILATHPDSRVRRPAEAIRLAEKASELTRNRNVNVLDTLAAAYAARGRYERAIATAHAAVNAAVRSGVGNRANRIERRLELYRRRMPYQEPPSREGSRSTYVLGGDEG